MDTRRHLFAGLASVGAAILLTAGPVLTTGASAAEPTDDISKASTVLGGHPLWMHFNDPPSRGDDTTIRDELVRLIKQTKAPATIQGTIHSITGGVVGPALVDAQSRGVTVRLVIDGKVSDPDYSSADKKSIALLDHVYCGPSAVSPQNACVSTASESNMHAKFFTFSSTTDPSGARQTDVSWFTSSNLTGESGTQQFNNAVTVYGDSKLKAGLDSFFGDLYAQKHYAGNDYLDAASSRGYRVGDSGTMYASPEKVGQTDTVADRLNEITPDASCRVRFGASMALNRPRIVSAVKRLKAGGCKVWMVVGSQDDPNRDKINMTKSSYDDLKAAGVDIRRRTDVHDKFTLVYGKFGSTYSYRLFTGSQNWSDPALNDNDELLVALSPEAGSTHPIYDAYYAHFNDAYNRGVSCDSRPFPCT